MWVHTLLSLQTCAQDRDAIRLAYRALAWATFYALAIVAVLVTLVVLLMKLIGGVESIRELRTRTRQQQWLNVAPKDPHARTEFDSIRDLFEYIENGEDSKKGATTSNGDER